MPRITIITPTYNRANLLAETIETILNQDFKDFKYLIIDDGSTDNTENIVKPYLKDARVKYYYHDNMGESATVNKGWERVNSDLAVIVNSDDPVKPKFLRVLVEFMDNNPHIIVAYPDWDMIDLEGKFIRHYRVPEYNMKEMIISHYCNPGPGAVIRKSALKDIKQLRDVRFKYTSDLATWWNLLLIGDFARIPYNIANWRRHKGAVTESLPLEVCIEHQIRIDKFFSRKDLPEFIKNYKQESYENLEMFLINIRVSYWRRQKGVKSYFMGIFEVIKILGNNKNYSFAQYCIAIKLLGKAIVGQRIYGYLTRIYYYFKLKIWNKNKS